MGARTAREEHRQLSRDADGRPHTTIVWVGLDGDEIVIGKLQPDQKVANIRRDPRVSLSMEAEGDQHGMQHYLVVEGTARITEGEPPSCCISSPSATSARERRFPDAEPSRRLHHPRHPSRVRGMGPGARSSELRRRCLTILSIEKRSWIRARHGKVCHARGRWSWW